MELYSIARNDMMQQQRRLETLQSARRWQPSDSIEAAKLDSRITAVRGVIRLFEYSEPNTVW